MQINSKNYRNWIIYGVMSCLLLKRQLLCFHCIPKWFRRWIMIGCKIKSFSIFRTLMLITGVPTQIPQSDGITGWMEHASFLPFPENFLKILKSPSMIYTLIACWKPLVFGYSSNWLRIENTVHRILFVECRRRLFHPGKVINKWHDCLRITCGEEPRVNALVERQVCVHGLCVIN